MIFAALIALLVTLAAIAIVGVRRAIKSAYRTGYDAGWIDHRIEVWRMDLARRARNGRFKPNNRIKTP